MAVQKAEKRKQMLRQPRLLQEQLQIVTDAELFLNLLETAIYEESSIDGYWVRGLTLMDVNCSRVTFRNVIFENCRFSACQFGRAGFRETIFRNCDLSNCVFSDSYWDCCTLQDVKGPGMLWAECNLHHLLFEHCQMRYVNFTGTLMESVQFQQCGLQESSISSCKHKQCQWLECDLTRADFFRTMLKQLDFSTCQIDGILLSDDYAELKGLTVNRFQALELAKLLGITIQ